LARPALRVNSRQRKKHFRLVRGCWHAQPSDIGISVEGGRTALPDREVGARSRSLAVRSFSGIGSEGALMWLVSSAVYWSSLAVIGYTYAGYPLLVYALSRLRPRATRAGDSEPTVSVVLAAHDES